MSGVDRPLIVAHRGLHDVHPENSARAFRAAADAGIDWVECDVQQSIDGYPVIMHDDTLDRTTACVGRVEGRRANELIHLRLRDRDGRPSNAMIPVLLAPRNELTGINANLLVEIKPFDAPHLVSRTARAMRARHRPWIIQSFDPTNLRHARRAIPEVERALLVGNAHDLLLAFNHDVSAIHVAQDLVSDELIGRIHNAGMKIGAWTVNEPADLRRMIELGVDRIITDKPALARSLLRGE